MKTDKKDLIEKAGERLGDLKRLQDAGLICLDGDFFPSVHYPPITMYPPAKEETLFEGYQNPPDGLFDIYVHIPFCAGHCTFCHYPVKIGDLSLEKDHYLQMLEKETDLYIKRLGLNIIRARSILIGGGTPTYLTLEQLNRFLESFTSRLDMTACTQFNYDVDPMTLLGAEGLERLKTMKAYGVDRLTIGVQSLEDEMLRKMNRNHSAEDAVRATERSMGMGFKTNIEFIYGYPGQTPDNWIKVMEKAISLGTEEIQLYRLKISPYGDRQGHILDKFSESPMEFPRVEQVVLLKQISILMLEDNGYFENLGRVFSRDREDFSHYADNQCCKLLDQIGLGQTAFSSLRDRFVLNTQDFGEYYAMIEQGRLPANRGLVRSKEDQMRWAIILPLKNREVIKKFYKMQTGVSLNEVFRTKIDRLKEFGLLFEDEKVLKLTRLGRFFPDEICQSFHSTEYTPFPRTAFAEGALNPYEASSPYS